MPLFCILLVVLSMPVQRPPTAQDQAERHRKELKELKNLHGDDADKRLREHLSAL